MRREWKDTRPRKWLDLQAPAPCEILGRVDSLYRRPLPPPLLAFASVEGRELFREALAEGTMDGYFTLAEQHHTQADPAFCGLSSLVVALNSLAIDPGRLWKGPWRWFSEELLDCCVPLSHVQSQGLVLDELACLAGCNGATARVTRAEASTASDLRAAVEAASRASSGRVLIASYSRVVLGQTGTGHYSPIAGFHKASDRALVLDVARFKYPPHWVAIEQLFEAMRPIDPATGKSRGFIELERAPAPRNLAFVFGGGGGWRPIARLLDRDLPAMLKEERPHDVAAVVRLMLDAARPVVRGIALRETTQPEHRAAVEGVLAELRSTRLYQLVVASGTELLPELATALLFLVEPAAWLGLAPELATEVRAVHDIEQLDEPLAGDLRVLRKQLWELQPVMTRTSR